MPSLDLKGFTKLSIIIPWRDVHQRDRNDIAEWCFERYRYLFTDAEIILCDSGDHTFSRGKSINKGVSEATGDYLIITDADYLFSEVMARELINKQPWTVAVKSENYYYLNERITKRILGDDPTTIDLKSIDIESNVSKCPFVVYGGVLAMPKENFIKFDEGYTGYGYEDPSFYYCMRAFHGKEFRTNNPMYHMYHIRTPGSLYMQKSYKNKVYYEKTWKPIENDRKAIRKLVEEKGMLNVC
jgi:predicted glycosyltransferase involved in capsule biosynthesis